MNRFDAAKSPLSAEEHQQKLRHDLEYGTALTRADLDMQPWDWERFDHIRKPGDPYIASIQQLGPVGGRAVLDAGCGDGWLSVILAKRGAYVSGCDISREAVRTARERFRINGVEQRCNALVGSLYSLPYADESFDLVCGQAILHHVSGKKRVGQELHRVLKPGARGVFLEPFANSRALTRLRRLVPVASESHDPNERQLRYADLEPFQDEFDIRVQEWQLLSRLDRILRSRWVIKRLQMLDLFLLRNLAVLRPYARAIVIELRRRA